MSAAMTGTTLANQLPEVWSQIPLITYRAKNVLEPLMDHTWEPELPPKRGDLVNVGHFSQNAAAKSRGTFGTGATITYDAVTEGQTQIAVDQMDYKAFEIPVEMTVQVISGHIERAIQGIGTAIASLVDSNLAADAGTTNDLDAFSAATDAADNVDVTEDVMMSGETNLNNVNADLENRYFVFSPGTFQSVRRINRIFSDDYSRLGDSIRGDKGQGYVGRIGTLDCYMSNQLGSGTAGKKNAIFQKEAIAFIGQKNLTMVTQLNITDGIMNQYAGYKVWGAKMMRSTFGLEVPGK